MCSAATVIVLDVNEKVIKDASWLCPKEDTKHINWVELNITIKRVNFVL